MTFFERLIDKLAGGPPNEKVLEDIEYEVFKDFSKKLEPTTKHDYLSKVILFKKFLQDKELVYAHNLEKIIKRLCDSYLFH